MIGAFPAFLTDKNELIPGATEASMPAGGFRRREKLVSRELNVPTHRLSEWCERALLGAESDLKEREPDARDAEIERLKAKVGEIRAEQLGLAAEAATVSKLAA